MQHSPEVRAAVVAAVSAGNSVLATARQHGVHPGTVRRWRFEAGVNASVVHQQKKLDIGQKVYELLEEYIETLRVQVRATRDEAWIKSQSANDLAILHGVLSDKAVRLLAAFRPIEDGGDE